MAGRIDLKSVGNRIRQFKYPALILLLGLALILWPSRQKQDAPAEMQPRAEEPSLETQMEEVLSCIDGAGAVRVLLTKASGDETVYQSDETVSKSNDSENTTRTTVMARGSGGGDVPVVRRTNYGEYRGALIVCSGADSAQVRLSIVNAVAGLTGLRADRITVIKMKQWEDAA